MPRINCGSDSRLGDFSFESVDNTSHVAECLAAAVLEAVDVAKERFFCVCREKRPEPVPGLASARGLTVEPMNCSDTEIQ